MTELRSCLDAMQGHHDDIQQARLVQLVWDTMRLKCLHIFGAGPSLMPRPDILNHQADFLIVSLSSIYFRHCMCFACQTCWALLLLWTCSTSAAACPFQHFVVVSTMHLKAPFCAWLMQIQLTYCQCVVLVFA